MTLRDPDADVSLQVTCRAQLLDAATVPIGEGQRVVMYARPEFFVPRGSCPWSPSRSAPRESASCWPESSSYAGCCTPKVF
jgi:exodeoxyribonuclease VII large subunit